MPAVLLPLLCLNSDEVVIIGHKEIHSPKLLAKVVLNIIIIPIIFPQCIGGILRPARRCIRKVRNVGVAILPIYNYEVIYKGTSRKCTP